MSLCLLFSIGFKGGQELAHSYLNVSGVVSLVLRMRILPYVYVLLGCLALLASSAHFSFCVKIQ
ncbi:hypothetical protein [Hymenobacter montanus]|uniref:hypothetical protein n=1 Tax=Hymenobacter montanus TaxID=2771359 RepID=UPI00374262B2